VEKQLSPGVIDSQTFIRKGDFWLKRGCFEKAHRYYEGSRQIAERIDNRYSSAQSLNKLAAVHLMSSDHAKALSYAQKALALNNESIDPHLQSSIFGNLASIAYALGKQEDAAKYWEESLSIANEYNIKSQKLVTLANLARARRLSGDSGASQAAIVEATKNMEDDFDKNNANVLLQYALLLREQGDYDGALSRIAEALALDREQEYTPGIAHDLRWLAEIQLRQGRINEGRANLDRSFFLFLALGARESLDAILATMKSFSNVFEADELEKYVSAMNTSDPKDAGAPDLCTF
jgi:tetratricopeptide (TPR) repeat protein